jgi:pyruvate,orthophosphate dikinase
MQVDPEARTLQFGSVTLHEGEILSLDGNDGAVYAGVVQTAVEPLAALQERLRRLRREVPPRRAPRKPQ